MKFLRAIFQPEVRSEVDLRKYVNSVTVAAVGVALTADVANQLIFYVDIAECLRSWAITTILAGGITWPIARAIGRAHLDLYRAKMEADRLGRTDPLTGLANRRAFTEAGISAEPKIVALAIADIDRFKRVNDEFGHLAGDLVIQAVAAMLERRLGDLGTLARVGGEEFALLCAAGSLDEVKVRIDLLRADVEAAAIRVEERIVRATLSVGVAAGGGASFRTLYSAADKALYAAKSSGRNRVVSYDEIDEPKRAA